MNTINIMVIGVGPHAKRIYVPALFKLAQKFPIKLAAAVDLVQKKDSIDQYLAENNYDLDLLCLDHFDASGGIPEESEKKLDHLIKKFNIQGVIISTEPTAHKVYAEWALLNGLNILMDKPISVRKDISVDQLQAQALIDDYNKLLILYKSQQANKSTIFSINVQRRYEYGFDKVRELVSETANKFNVPITSMQVMHADGSWRFPQEILFQDSHGLFDGFGKVAHSGYHLFDMAWQIYVASMLEDKGPNGVEVFSSPFTPCGLDVCLNEEDYNGYFGADYQPTGFSRKQYLDKVKNFGELDSFNIIRLLRAGENICNISISLLHSSFSRRSWAAPNEDLYKGNGRVKHQQFILQQGPFQSIHVHNYQSKDKHDVDNTDEFDVGGNNHFDIYVFRNVDMYGAGKAFTKISGYELEKKSDTLTGENAKYRVIVEFIEFLLGRTNISAVKSNIDSHEVPVKLMSGVCQSGAKVRLNQSPLVRIDI